MKPQYPSPFRLRIPLPQLAVWASRYDASQDALIETDIAPRAKKRGWLSKPDFLSLARWKSPRSQSRCARNSEEYIKAVTQTALSTPDERLRIEVLTLLQGVSWPTASVILHFAHSDPYPILDVRALWSVGVETPPSDYTFEFWHRYTQFCQELARKSKVTMRTLDRALWQYSKAKTKR
jgi:hypothetical protein